MKNKPDFIDNLYGNSMVNALKSVLENLSNKATSNNDIENKIEELRIATAYFSPEGFSRISPLIKDIPSIKLMLGSDPIADSERWEKKLNESENNEENIKKSNEAKDINNEL